MTTAGLQRRRFKISSDRACASQGFESSWLVPTAPGRGLGSKTSPCPAAASPPHVSGGVVGWILVVALPAKRLELLWGDATSPVALMKPVAWGSPQLGVLAVGPPDFWGRGEMSSRGLAECGVLRLLPAPLGLVPLGALRCPMAAGSIPVLCRASLWLQSRGTVPLQR